MKTFRDLLVWQKAMDLVTEVYKHSRMFPKEESYGLTSQLRRCAVSIPSNLAEGYGRRSNNEFNRFTQIATGSLYELQTQLELSMRLGYIKDEDYTGLHDQSREVERMLNSLTRTLQEQTA